MTEKTTNRIHRHAPHGDIEFNIRESFTNTGVTWDESSVEVIERRQLVDHKDRFTPEDLTESIALLSTGLTNPVIKLGKDPKAYNGTRLVVEGTRPATDEEMEEIQDYYTRRNESQQRRAKRDVHVARRDLARIKQEHPDLFREFIDFPAAAG